MEQAQKEAIDFCLKLSEIFATIFVGFGLMTLSLSSQIDAMNIGIYGKLYDLLTSNESIINDATKQMLLESLKPMIAGLDPKIKMMTFYSDLFRAFFLLSIACLIIIIPIKFDWRQTKVYWRQIKELSKKLKLILFSFSIS